MDPASAEPGSKSPLGERLGTGALVVGGLAFSLVIAELALHLLEADAYRVWPPNLERTLTPDPLLLPGVSGPSRFSTNAWGMRGDPWNESATQHILAVGGSATICVYLDDSEAWPHLVQEMLNEASGPDRAWVGNVGRLGHATPQYVQQIEKLLQQHHEIDTVLLMAGANDFSHPLSARRSSARKDSAARGKPDRPPSFRGDLFSAFSQVPADHEGPWYRRSALVRMLAARRWRRDSREPLPLLDDSGRFYEKGRECRRRASKFRDRLPDMSATQRQFVRNLDRIVDLTRSAGVRLILITQPTLWDAHLSPSELDLLWSECLLAPPDPGEPLFSAAALAEGMAAFNRLLLQVCDRHRIECIDAAERLPRSSEIFYDDVHLTEEGSRRLAALIADFLLKHEAPEQRGAGTGVP